MVMVGISTEQNTANFIPAVLLNVQKLILFESSKAQFDNWSEGIKAALSNRKIETQLIQIPNGDETRIDVLELLLTTKLNDIDSVYFNVGGGLKPQQLAMWQVFRNRRGMHKDTVCYANQNGRVPSLELWDYEEESLRYNTIPIYANFTIKEILLVFGKEIINEKNLKTLENLEMVDDWLDFQEFREYLFKRASSGYFAHDDVDAYTISEIDEIIRQNLKVPRFSAELTNTLTKSIIKKLELNSDGDIDLPITLNKLRKAILNSFTDSFIHLLRRDPSSEKIAVKDSKLIEELKKKQLQATHLIVNKNYIKNVSTGESKFAFYFEKVLFQRIKAILEGNQHNVSDVWFNISTVELSSGMPIAEYDVLFCTRFGTLVALDAKTYGFEKKDNDARLLNLEKSGGKFVKLVPVLPLYRQDIETDYLPKVLKTIPSRFKERGVPFASIMEKELADYLLYVFTNATGFHYSISAPEETVYSLKTYEIKNLETVLKQTGVIK